MLIEPRKVGGLANATIAIRQVQIEAWRLIKYSENPYLRNFFLKANPTVIIAT